VAPVAVLVVLAGVTAAAMAAVTAEATAEAMAAVKSLVNQHQSLNVSMIVVRNRQLRVLVIQRVPRSTNVFQSVAPVMTTVLSLVVKESLVSL